MKMKTWKNVVFVVALAGIWLMQNWLGGNNNQPSPVSPPTGSTTRQTETRSGELRLAGPFLVENVTITDINTGKTFVLERVDLRPTLQRIAAGKKNAHRNDGSVFQNRSRLLPQKPSGYYREYVVPTKEVSGPGPQRLVLGREGEIYYTHDHYNSFIRIPEEN